MEACLEYEHTYPRRVFRLVSHPVLGRFVSHITLVRVYLNCDRLKL
jgi:hypothetical protein